jgi:3-dehydroquinate synthase
MIAATHIAAATNRIDKTVARGISEVVLSLGPLPRIEARSRDIVRLLRSDKKTRNGVVHFVLPREIGKVEVVNDVPEKIVVEAVNEVRRLSTA